MLKLPLEEHKILETVEREYQLALNTVVKKRQMFRDQDKYLNDISGNSDKIDMKTLYYVVNTLLALYYTDEVIVDFAPRRFGMEDQSRNLKALARFDYNEMNMSVIDYEVQLNRLMRGVGIKVMTGWNTVTQCPIYECVDTRQWIPDPRGWFDPKDFRFHGFEFSMTRDELTDELGYDAEAVAMLQSEEDPQTTITRNYANRAAGLNPNMDNATGGNQMLSIYHHFTRIDGKPYMITTGNVRKKVIRCIEIEPVYEEEKKDSKLIPFPVTLYYYSPKKYDPYGTSITDLLQDKHRFKNVLANLMFIREKDAALGDDVLYDTNLIKNRNDLSQSTLNKKFIGVDGTRGAIQNAVSVVPRNPAGASNYNFTQFLDRSIEMAVGVDARQMGVQAQNNITATEAQQLQANNNLKSIFQNRINGVGEKYFWKLWMRAYREHFKSSEKKIVRVTNSFGTKNIEFSKQDFITSQDPDIEIKAASETRAEKDAQKANLTPLLLSVMNNPNKPAISKNMAERKLYDLNGIEEDEALVYAPPTYEEMDALQKLQLLNMNNMEGAEIDESDVDHLTYIVVFQRGLDTPAKFAAIEARKNMMIMMGQQQQQQQPDGNSFNNMASNQMLNQAQQQNNKTQVQSREQVQS